MLGLKDLAQQLAVWVNGEYSGFGESSLDMLGAKATDSTIKIPTDADVKEIGIDSIVVEYNASDSTTIPDTGWVINEPENADTPFWSRLKITRTNGDVKTFVSFSGGKGGGGGSGGSAIGSVSYKLPDIVDGSNYTTEQLKYWRDKFYTLQDVELRYASSDDASPVTIDTPSTKSGILYKTSSNGYRSIAIMVRYMRINPGINISVVPPGADIILSAIQATDTTYEIVKCRVKDSLGDIWEGFIDASSPSSPKTVVGNKFKYGESCFYYKQNYSTGKLVVNREIGYDTLALATSVDYSDATTNYNDETPFAYVIPTGSTVLTFDNTTGKYNFKDDGDVIIQPYVGRWKAPLYYLTDTYGKGTTIYTRPASVYVKYNDTFGANPKMFVPTKTHPGIDTSDKITIFQKID